MHKGCCFGGAEAFTKGYPWFSTKGECARWRSLVMPMGDIFDFPQLGGGRATVTWVGGEARPVMPWISSNAQDSIPHTSAKKRSVQNASSAKEEKPRSNLILSRCSGVYQHANKTEEGFTANPLQPSKRNVSWCFKSSPEARPDPNMNPCPQCIS